MYTSYTRHNYMHTHIYMYICGVHVNAIIEQINLWI